MMDHYILDENDVPVAIAIWRDALPWETENGVPTVGKRTIDQEALLRWGGWYEKAYRRIVKQEHVGRSWVSTVFLSLDHSFSFGSYSELAERLGIEIPPEPHEPILWETMVFGGKMNDDCNRCGGLRLDAESMHFRMVLKVREAEGWRVRVYGVWWNWIEPMLAEQLYDWHDLQLVLGRLRRAKRLEALKKSLPQRSAEKSRFLTGGRLMRPE